MSSSKKSIIDYEIDSLIDFEGENSLCLFYKGCNLRCRYCYNKNLWDESVQGKDFNSMVKEHAGKDTTAICLLGGEPTYLWGETLAKDVSYSKKRGYKVKLFTNGLRPKIIHQCLIAGLDAISVDFKYVTIPEVIGVDFPSYFSTVRTTLEMLKEYKIKKEIRIVLEKNRAKEEDFYLKLVGKDLARDFKVIYTDEIII